ncbi:MAG TPA: permease, partial [Actinomycetota bacterium]|nr:permease [Actinomycetota bacterium]
MVDVAPPQPARNATVRTTAVIVAVLALAAGLLRILEPGRIPWIQASLIVFGSLVVQAMPFVLVGALASAAIEVFVPVNALERLAGLPRPLQLPAAALAGVAFPICECGSVPVARRLAARGLTPSAAVTFMLAAPVLNPVVIASTFVAYRARSSLWTMVIGRFALGMLVAVVVGWVVGSRSKDEVLRPRSDEARAVLVEPGPPEARWRRFFFHTGSDFLFMGRYLLIGAAAAAMVQTFLPASFVSTVAGTPVLDIAVMMGLATVLSLCSESDAFVAASFVQFGPGAQLAFLVSGPMIDLKLGALYAG